ncbi:MAG: metal-dependent hydrolase [Chloroflexota bacterium]
MDLLSHALVGGLVASAGLQKKYGLVASATMVAANLIPDLDGAFTALGPKYFFQYHRHPLTHSVGGATLLSAALTAIVCLATPLKRPWLVFGVSLSGMTLHLLSDLLTPWPIPLFWPLSTRTYSLDLIHFFDPFLLAILGVGFLVIQRRAAWAVPALLLTGLVTAGYLGFRAYGKQVALDLVRRRVRQGKWRPFPMACVLSCGMWS